MPLQPWQCSGSKGLQVIDLVNCSVGVMEERFTVGPNKLPAFTLAIAAEGAQVSTELEISMNEAVGLMAHPPARLLASGWSAASATGTPVVLPHPEAGAPVAAASPVIAPPTSFAPPVAASEWSAASVIGVPTILPHSEASYKAHGSLDAVGPACLWVVCC